MGKLEGQGGSWGVGGGREVRAKRLNPALFRVGFVGKRLKIRNRCGGLIHLLIVLIHCYLHLELKYYRSLQLLNQRI